jgi:hypothetical protein
MYVTPDRIDAPLFVVTCLFNPVRFKSRWKLYQRFAAHVKASGAILVTIEAAFGERAHALDSLHGIDVTTEPSDPALTRSDATHQYLRVRTGDELWVKENLLSIAMQHLPPDAQYIAWIDADVIFTRPNWVGETIHQLQHYAFLQLFSRSQDLSPIYESVGPVRQSFTDGWQHGIREPHPEYGYHHGLATGLAWAARREALDAVGGLPDFCVLGSADWHLAHALIGKIDLSRPDGLSQDYKDRLLEWQFRAERFVRRSLGTVSGLVLHYWHGRKSDRGYSERWKPLIDLQYAPSIDLKKNTHGVLQLCDRGDERSMQLRDAFKTYFRSRAEDSIDV